MPSPLYRRIFAHFNQTKEYPGLSRVISTAASNPDFEAQLVTDPAAALAQSAYDFQLSEEEYNLIVSISQATDGYDFAQRLYTLILGSTAPEGADEQ